MLARFVELETNPEVVQFSGGEPTIHPELIEMIAAARQHDINFVMVNTNGLRIAKDDEWFERFAALQPLIYVQCEPWSRPSFDQRSRMDIWGTSRPSYGEPRPW